jgi:hypothetical protein
VIDCTETMNLNDIKPTRFKFLAAKLELFIQNYFSYNYCSTITLLSMKNYTTQIVYPHSLEAGMVLKFLQNEKEPEGFPSIFNALNVASDCITLQESRFNVDIVIFYSSQKTLDRGNIYEVLHYFINESIEINIFSFENPPSVLNVYIFLKIKFIATLTNGIVYKPFCLEDIDKFMNYIVHKKVRRKLDVAKFHYINLNLKSKSLLSDEHCLLCCCHGKLW